MTRLRTCGLARTTETEMPEQSLFRRFAPYKPYSGSQKNNVMAGGVILEPKIVDEKIKSVPVKT